MRTVDEDVEEVEAREDVRRGGAHDAVREEDREQDAERGRVAEADRAVRANRQRGRDHLRAARVAPSLRSQRCRKTRRVGKGGSRKAHQVKSMEHTNVTCPVTFAQPVNQLASADHRGGAIFAEK